MNTLNVILNDKITQAHAGESILELCKRNGIEIPTLCHDDRLEPFSSCYVCVVEVEGMRGLQPSCSTKVTEGMKIYTDNEKVHKSRKASLDLLLSNHYADCVAPCKETCPAGVDVQGYIALISKGLYSEAVKLIKETNPLPAICGRVCVRPCEVACRRNLVDGLGVGIDYLKRYASDIDLSSPEKFVPEIKPATNKKVAVIGAGPGGLTAAYYLALEGHQAEIFEALPHPGGMLRYGIPPYRLPNEIINEEVKNITDLGVKINYNKKLGDNFSYKEIKENFDATVITIGSQIGTGIGCENDDADNIFSGIDFLGNMEKTGQKFDFSGKRVAVIGGGNTAMDCCRTAMRCGAEEVYVIYRRTEKEMPANPIEIHESKIEGIKYMFLTAPAKVIKNEDGTLQKLVCFKMELGEPDASGRRRPVKIDNSEFEIELDYILAAIGQKTNVNFIEDINSHAGQEFVLNKWGDIDAHAETLQTSIPSVFAAGDAVTGPATLIEAIAQGRKAAKSTHQFIMGLPFEPEATEFLSLKDNFEEQKEDDYKESFVHLERKEMPVLDAEARHNFNEVELGYSEEMATEETARCLECGCTAYFDCELKKHATTYNAEQKRYEGTYKKYEVDFAHPFIEIDNNKCVLCSRCIRICKDVVSANALGLINRGFDTYVAPSMGNKLADTTCESCGMCISTCPTAALSENVPFKPGPVKTESFQTICNFCSIGCEVELHHVKGFYTAAKGHKGMINKDGNICKYPKFGYNFLNKERITKPMRKVNGKFEELTFEEAYNIIQEKIGQSPADKNAVFAGGRLTNEELYLIQKWTRTALKTNNISSFYNWKEDTATYADFNNGATPLDDIEQASKIVLLASEINNENAVAGFMINNAVNHNNAELCVIDENPNNSMFKKAHKAHQVKSNYYFVKALNHYFINNSLHNNIFVNANCEGFSAYKEAVLKEDFNLLLSKAGVSLEELKNFADDYNHTHHAVILYAEKNSDMALAQEIYNLSLITGKRGKRSSGVITLKEKNNAQGLLDMGVTAARTVATLTIDNTETQSLLKTVWGTDTLPEKVNEPATLLENKDIDNLFIFGEDPLGCAKNKEAFNDLTAGAAFMVVQDVYMSATAEQADLILPASLHFEIGGSFTNTHRAIQKFEAAQKSKVEQNSYQQLTALLNKAGVKHNVTTPDDIFSEYSRFFEKYEKPLFHFVHSEKATSKKAFSHGCDSLTKAFDKDFEEKMAAAKE